VNVALILLLVVHGLIHGLGFAKAWDLAALPQLTWQTLVPVPAALTRVIGLAWLAPALLLLAAAALRTVRKESWWFLAAAAVLLSQALIVLHWHDAKAGSVANLLIALALAVAAGAAHFRAAAEAEMRALRASVRAEAHGHVQASELEKLPVPVRRWLEASGVVGRERARSVHLQQRGELRTNPHGAWMPARAEQYFTVERPAFVWHVDATMLHALPIAGTDSFRAGKGRMLIKLASLLTLVDATGTKIDQGAMLRFLGEIVWFPSAALRPYIRWEALDAQRAGATMRYAGMTCAAVFSFDEQGHFVRMTAQRYLGEGEREPWMVTASAWRRVRGLMLPVRGTVSWSLKSGDFDYYRWEILDVEENRVGHSADLVRAAHAQLGKKSLLRGADST
jgi:hypothetical protein